MLDFDIVDFLLVAVIFTPLERLAPTRRGQKVFRKLLLLDLYHVVFSGMMIRAGVAGMLVLASSSLKTVLPAEIPQTIQGQPVWLQFLEVLLMADFIFYTVHRLFHAVPALWRIHVIHHSIEEMDWVAAHRVHPIDQALTKGLSLAPAILLGFSPAAIAMFVVMYKWQALLIHSNVKAPFGPLRFLLVSPVFHHWHHANHDIARDKNFAGQLSILDFIFGTAYLPKGQTPQRYGVDDPIPVDYPGQLIYPFQRWFGRRADKDAGDQATIGAASVRSE